MYTSLQNTLSELPQELSAPIQQAMEPLLRNTPLRVVCLGAYSVGKSSVLNALLGDHLLPVGQEEVTAIPTLISHQPTAETAFARCELTSTGLQQEALSREAFMSLASGEQPLSSSPTEEEQLTYLNVAHPAPWLNGVELFDLPGLSGNDPERAALTRAQVNSADAVIYLLFPKGPTQTDIETMNYVRAQGRALRVFVAQWDVALSAHAERGERLPSLDEWSARISAALQGAEPLQLTPLSAHTRLGLDELVTWVSHLSTHAKEVRAQRLSATITPLIERALTQLSEQRAALEERGEEAKQALHTQLSEAQRALIQQERSLSTQRTERWRALSAQLSALQEGASARLRRELNERVSAWTQAGAAHVEERWGDYLNEALAVRQRLLSEHIEQLNELQQTQLNLTELLEDTPFELLPPQAPPLQLDEVRAMAELERMRSEASLLQSALQDEGASEQKLAQERALQEQHKALHEQIEALQAHQRELLTTPLPMIEEPGSSTGSMIGRMIGEVADIALIFVQPQMAATKVGSMASKLGMSAKNVKMITEGIKQVGRGAQKVQKALPKPVQTVTNALSALSVSYWGEKIGSYFDQPPVLRVDEQAKAALTHQRSAVSAELSKLLESQSLLQAKLGEQGGGERVQQQRLQDLQRLERQIKELEQRQLEERKREEEYAQGVLKQQLTRRLEQLSTQSLLRFQAELRGAERALREAFKAYWDDTLAEALSAQKDLLERLKGDLERSPAEKSARLAELTAYEQGLVALQKQLSVV